MSNNPESKTYLSVDPQEFLKLKSENLSLKSEVEKLRKQPQLDNPIYESLMDFVLGYHNSKNKDIANDAAYWYADNIAPLQQSNEALQKEVLELNANVSAWRFAADTLEERKNALQKKVEELKEKNNELIMDDMTREYNEAEAERTEPHFIEQANEEIERLQKENSELREKIEALRHIGK